MAILKKSRTRAGTLLSPAAKQATIEKLQEENKTALDTQLRSSLSMLETAVGGRQALVEALAVSKNPAAIKFITAVGKATNGNVPLYDILQSINTSADELIKIFTEGKMVRAQVETYVRLAEGLPDVLNVALDSARVPGSDGFNDRKMLFGMAGMTKQEANGPGPTILNQISFGTDGTFEKIVTRQHSPMSQNPFEIEAEEVTDEK